jgi:phenylacetate-CoA ligase
VTAGLEHAGVPASPFGDWDATVRTFLRAARRSPFVRRQLERSSLRARDAVSSAEAWRRLVPITKDDLLADQELDPPFGERRCVPVNELGLVVESSGSTGRGREVHYLSRRDNRLLVREWGRYLGAMGIGRDDVIALAFPIGMAGGGVKHWQAYAELGARVLRLANLSSARKLEAMSYYRATALVATPAYVDRLAAVAGELDLRPRELEIRRIVVATQSVSVEWVRATEALWGARLHEWYGTSAGLTAFSCRLGMVDERGERGTLHWNPELAFYEIVRPETDEWVPDGGRGELVGTPLRSEAEPLFRVATGDEVRFRAPGACACGSAWPGIESGTIRRLDAMFKIKGVNVWPGQVEATLLEFTDVLDYRARIWQDDERRERVRVEVLAHPCDRDDLAGRLGLRLRDRTGLSFEVGVVEEPGSWTQETVGEAAKVTRWVDERAGA